MKAIEGSQIEHFRDVKDYRNVTFKKWRPRKVNCLCSKSQQVRDLEPMFLCSQASVLPKDPGRRKMTDMQRAERRAEGE